MPPPSPPTIAPFHEADDRDPLRTPTLVSTRVTATRGIAVAIAPSGRIPTLSLVTRVKLPTTGIERSDAARSHTRTRLPTTALATCAVSGTCALRTASEGAPAETHAARQIFV